MSRSARLRALLERTDLKAGPELHAEAMSAATRGEYSEALALLERLKALLELDDEGLGQLLGQAAGEPPVPPLVDQLDGFAEGGSVDEDRPKLSFLQAVGRSLAGAVPFKGGDPEFVETVGDLPARAVSGFKSQWWGVNPTTGEVEYAGPLSSVMHGRSRPPYPDEALLGIDPAEYRRQFKAWRDWKPAVGPIPGIIDETMALPLLADIVKPGLAPDLAYEAGDRADELRTRLRAESNLDEPEGFTEHLTESLGIMGGQLPIPGALIRRAPAEAAQRGALSRAGRILGATPRAGVEFLSPIIEPKIGNYIAGALFGGALGTALDPAEVPPELEELVARAEAGDEEAYNELKRIWLEYQMQQEMPERTQRYGESEDVQEALERLRGDTMYSRGGRIKRGLHDKVTDLKRQRLLREKGLTEDDAEELYDWVVQQQIDFLRSLKEAGKEIDPEDLQWLVDRGVDPGTVGLAKGGDVKKALTRRDFLKGLGAAGAATLGAGKVALREGDPEVALKQIEEVLDVAPASAKGASRAVIRSDLFRSVAERIRAEGKDWFDQLQADGDNIDASEMWDMYDTDARVYDKVADLLDEGELNRAARLYDRQDTSAREYIYDYLEGGDRVEAQRTLGEGQSDWEWADIQDHPDFDEIVEEAQRIFDTEGNEALIRYQEQFERSGWNIDELGAFIEE